MQQSSLSLSLVVVGVKTKQYTVVLLKVLTLSKCKNRETLELNEISVLSPHQRHLTDYLIN